MAYRLPSRQSWCVVLGLVVIFLLLFLSAGQIHARDGDRLPTQARVLSCLYQMLEVDDSRAKYPDSICRKLKVDDQAWLRAITRTDFSIKEDGVAVAWLEMLSKTNDLESAVGQIERTQYEIKLRLQDSQLALVKFTKVTDAKRVDGLPFEEEREKSRISGVAYEWLSLFESSTRDHRERFVTEYLSGVTIESDSENSLRSDEAVSRWLADRVDSYHELRQRIGELEFVKSSEGTYSVRFLVDWKAEKRDGTLVVGRQSHRWLVKITPRGRVKVSHVQINDLLPLPDMATRFFC